MRKKFMRNPVRQGFTLIELVVSMAVFSLMMLLMMQFFTDTQKLWSRSEDKANMYADARVAMDLMSSALQSVYYQESSGTGQADNQQERYFIASTAASNTAGGICFPVNLSRNSPLYPNPSDTVARPFYLRFHLDGNVLRYSEDGGSTSFVGAASAPSASSVNNRNEEVIGNITHLSFRLFNGDFSLLNSSAYSGQRFPYSVQITMKMMPKAAFDTWVAQGRDANAEQIRFREENEYEFVRIIYLGVY